VELVPEVGIRLHSPRFGDHEVIPPSISGAIDRGVGPWVIQFLMVSPEILPWDGENFVLELMHQLIKARLIFFSRFLCCGDMGT